jgi:hypothetical protein
MWHLLPAKEPMSGVGGDDAFSWQMIVPRGARHTVRF